MQKTSEGRRFCAAILKWLLIAGDDKKWLLHVLWTAVLTPCEDAYHPAQPPQQALPYSWSHSENVCKLPIDAN